MVRGAPFCRASQLLPSVMRSEVATLISSIQGINFCIATRSPSNEIAVLIGLTDQAAARFAERHLKNGVEDAYGVQRFQWQAMSLQNVR